MTTTRICPRERELIGDALHGNGDAFGELVRQYRGRLVSKVLTIVRCPADAEDVVQDALLQAYIKLPTFQGKSSFYTWLYRIAVNTALSRGRHKRVRISVDQTRDLLGEDPIDPNGAPDTPLLRDEHALQIKRAFAALREDYRTILILRGLDGNDYETIGQKMKLNPGTVRSRLHRARSQLREQLGDASHCHA
jgi:RNA polymerase sigma-70 factor (ECF subfamily)